MNTQFLFDKLLKAFPFPPSPGQEKLLYAVSRMLISDKDRCALIVKGYAGTGKTTSVGAMVEVLDEIKMNCVLLAPTGRAAKVLGKYSGRSASTIHRKIYHKRTVRGSAVFELAPNMAHNTLFIVDEASMIGRAQGNSGGSFNYRDLLEDLMDYVFNGKGCRLLLIGDGAQLPPVGWDESPALDLELLRREFYLTIAQVELTEVVRQAQESGILMNATRLRELIRQQSTAYPQITPTADVIRLAGDELEDALDKEISHYGKEQVLVITRSNKGANLFNQQIRVRIHWLEDRISAGELLMVVKNNYYWLDPENKYTSFIANGDILELLQVVSTHELYGFTFFKVRVKLIDYPEMVPFEVNIIAEALDVEAASLPQAEVNKLFEEVALDYLHLGLKPKIRKAVKEDPWFNALQIKFAYAVTCHKAQGGQWPVIFVDQGYLKEEMLGTEYLRWLYTAMTRAVDKVYMVNFHPKFYETE